MQNNYNMYSSQQKGVHRLYNYISKACQQSSSGRTLATILLQCNKQFILFLQQIHKTEQSLFDINQKEVAIALRLDSYITTANRRF